MMTAVAEAARLRRSYTQLTLNRCTRVSRPILAAC